MGLLDWWDSVMDWFSNFQLPDLEGLFESWNLEAGPLAISFFAVFFAAIILLDNFMVFTGDVTMIPFLWRLFGVVAIGPIAYFVTKKVLSR